MLRLTPHTIGSGTKAVLTVIGGFPEGASASVSLSPSAGNPCTAAITVEPGTAVVEHDPIKANCRRSIVFVANVPPEACGLYDVSVSCGGVQSYTMDKVLSILKIEYVDKDGASLDVTLPMESRDIAEAKVQWEKRKIRPGMVFNTGLDQLADPFVAELDFGGSTGPDTATAVLVTLTSNTDDTVVSDSLVLMEGETATYANAAGDLKIRVENPVPFTAIADTVDVTIWADAFDRYSSFLKTCHETEAESTAFQSMKLEIHVTFSAPLQTDAQDVIDVTLTRDGGAPESLQLTETDLEKKLA